MQYFSEYGKQDDFRWYTDECMHFYFNSYVEKYIISLQNRWSHGYYLRIKQSKKRESIWISFKEKYSVNNNIGSLQISKDCESDM